MFTPEPQPLGWQVQACGGIAPRDTWCQAPIAAHHCIGRVCNADVAPAPGFTGVIAGSLSGRTASHELKSVGWACSYTAGSRTTLTGVVNGECWAETSWGCDAGCTLYPFDACDCYLLTGQARGHRLGPVGAWSVKAIAG